MPPRDLRRVLSDAWERLEDADRERVNELAGEMWEQALTATRDQLVRGYEIICPSCTKRKLYDIPVSVPDVLTRVKALEILANQAWGPRAEPERVVSITVRTVQELAALPDEELALVAGAVDAEWAPLELPAGEAA